MSFVKTLPVELSAVIFSLVCEPAHFGQASLTQPIYPLRFGAICQSWRYLAWSTPLLWAYVYCQSYPSCQDSQIELLEAWLSRGNGGPLAVVFLSGSEETNGPREGHQPILYDERLFAALARVSHRWRSIDLLIADDAFYPTLNLVHHKVPHLEKVRFRTSLNRSQKVTFLEGATSLSHMMFDFYSSGFQVSPDSYRKMTSLYFGYIPLTRFLPIASLSHTNLQHMHIQNLIPDRVEVSNPLDFPNLKSLVLPWTGLGRLLSLFASVPKLRKLEVKVSGSIVDSKLEEFLLKAQASLCSLRLSRWINGVDDVKNIVRTLGPLSERLSELCLHLHTYSSNGFEEYVSIIHEALTVAPHSSDGLDCSSKSLFPHLQRYVFAETSAYTSFTEGLSCIPILNMVESRVKAHKFGLIKEPLKEVFLGQIWAEEIKQNTKFFSNEVQDLVTVMEDESHRRNILTTEWHLE